VKEASKMTGFSTWIFYEAIKDRSLPHVAIGARKVIPRKALRAFLADRLVLE
jgi:excisionase family DNA binding protein